MVCVVYPQSSLNPKQIFTLSLRKHKHIPKSPWKNGQDNTIFEKQVNERRKAKLRDADIYKDENNEWAILKGYHIINSFEIYWYKYIYILSFF